MYPSFDRFSDHMSWGVGDRVLAPWEPDFLYAGTIGEVRGDEAHIDFDDGDSGWVPLDELRELLLEVEQVVLCRKQMGPLFHPAIIEDVSGETVHVAFADGEKEWTTVAAVRVPREPGAGAEPTNIGSPHAFVERLERGLRVLAPWENFFLYPATVLEVQGDEVHVHFDDGDSGWVLLHQVHPLEIPVGLTISVRGRGLRFEVADVLSVEGDQVKVALESGARRVVPIESVRIPCIPAGPNARPSGLRQPEGRSRSVWIWLVPLLVIAGILFALKWLVG
jgi:hypothetical protein